MKSNLNILLVEDDLMEAQRLIGQLNDLGYVYIAHCQDSESSFAAVKRKIPDLIIMDIGLQGSEKDGIEIAKTINELHTIPIIFLSSFSDRVTLARANETSFAGYLVKPATSKQLFVAIETTLPTIGDEKKENSSDETELHNHFFVKGTGHYYHRVSIDELLWIESVRGGIQIITESQPFMLTASMSSFFNQFHHPKLIRVHRSFAVNHTKVTAINEHTIIIPYKSQDKRILISRTYWDKVKYHFDMLKSD